MFRKIIKFGLFFQKKNISHFVSKKFLNHNLCLVTDAEHAKKSGRSLESIVKSAIDGGCTMIQYREKKLDYENQKVEALKIQKICKEKHIPFLINDNVKLAIDIGADGVHVGQDDMQASQVRKTIGNQAILGVTVHNPEEVKKAIAEGADYLGTGAIYDSITKPVKPLGLEMLKELIKSSSIPIIAIGGINEQNAKRIIEHGSTGIAVSSGILLSDDPTILCRKLSNIVCIFQAEQMKKNMGIALKKIKEKKPLIFHLTNNVVMNQSANITLSIGGSPIMASDLKEMEDIMKISDALLINIGTIREEMLESMLLAGQIANQYKKPIILDPVGVGASNFRYKVVSTLLDQLKISIIKGNSSEIQKLYKNNQSNQQKGVDGETSIENPEIMVQEVAKSREAVVVMTGYHDYISDGKSVVILRNNCEYLQKITGSGCIAGSLIATFASIEKNYLVAASGGIAALTCSAEMIEKDKDVKGPMSFQTALFDQIHYLDQLGLERQVDLIKIR